jgi:hypothetical protein
MGARRQMSAQNATPGPLGRDRGPHHSECESTIARLRDEVHLLRLQLNDARGGLIALEHRLRHQGCCDGTAQLS